MKVLKLIRADIGLLGTKLFEASRCIGGWSARCGELVDSVVGVSVGVSVGNVGVFVGEADGVCAGGELIGCIVVGLIYAVIDTL